MPDTDLERTPTSPENIGEAEAETKTVPAVLAANLPIADLSDTKASGSKYPYLKGFPLYNLLAALMLAMLLLGLDINIVATVNGYQYQQPSSLESELNICFTLGHSNYFRLLQQYR